MLTKLKSQKEQDKNVLINVSLAKPSKKTNRENIPTSSNSIQPQKIELPKPKVTAQTLVSLKKRTSEVPPLREKTPLPIREPKKEEASSNQEGKVVKKEKTEKVIN